MWLFQVLAARKRARSLHQHCSSSWACGIRWQNAWETAEKTVGVSPKIWRHRSPFWGFLLEDFMVQLILRQNDSWKSSNEMGKWPGRDSLSSPGLDTSSSAHCLEPSAEMLQTVLLLTGEAQRLASTPGTSSPSTQQISQGDLPAFHPHWLHPFHFALLWWKYLTGKQEREGLSGFGVSEGFQSSGSEGRCGRSHSFLG